MSTRLGTFLAWRQKYSRPEPRWFITKLGGGTRPKMEDYASYQVLFCTLCVVSKTPFITKTVLTVPFFGTSQLFPVAQCGSRHGTAWRCQSAERSTLDGVGSAQCRQTRVTHAWSPNFPKCQCQSTQYGLSLLLFICTLHVLRFCVYTGPAENTGVCCLRRVIGEMVNRHFTSHAGY